MVNRNGIKNEKSDLFVIKIALQHFFSTHKGVYLVLFVVFSSIILSKYFDYKTQELYLLMEKDTSDSKLKSIIFYILLTEVLDISFHKLQQIVFVSLLTQYRTNIASSAFKYILYNGIKNNIDLTNGSIQFAVLEGTKGLENLIDCLVIYILPQLVSIFLFCRKLNSGFGNLISFMIFLSLAVSVYIQIKITKIKLKSKKINNKSRCKSDTILYEAFNNLETINLMSTEEYESVNYKNELQYNQKFYVHFERMNSFFIFLHKIFFSIVKTITCILFLTKNNENNDSGTKMRCLMTFINKSDKSIDSTGKLFTYIKESILNSKLVLDYIEDIRNEEENYLIISDLKSIKFKNVEFLYENISIFKEINFEIKIWKNVAVYSSTDGLNTLLIKLIFGFKKYKGEILINDVELKDIDNKIWLKNIFYFQPDFNLFNNTIEFNILYGNFNVSKSDMVNISKKIGLHESIINKIDEYQTQINDNDTLITVEEKHKILFARGILKKPKIIILSESYCKAVNQSIKSLSTLIRSIFTEITIIFLTCDIKTLSFFDQIIFIKENGVDFCGTFDNFIKFNLI
ncbi:putative ABC transporter [Hamiltosporidium tvaerminnensis]|uniref:Putative ABC transporter n=1 Tax=Hamiltosporidium tvaerminnensis TaxID=1176355 RepID=A0A4V6MV96_9MICR|nr:putative ABC transporter [Hamiltosporidium tvaerminnensis]